jgi:hypothetical protein
MTDTKTISEHLDIEYNSQRENLEIAEYGRHVQNLIDFAKKIEDKDKRQTFTEGVIYLMYQMNSQSKKLEEVEEKLWKHAFRISNYELDVTPPEGVVLCKQEIEAKPEPIHYPHRVRKYRHYGGYIQDMVGKAMELEDPQKQREFVQLIGSYLKLAYKTWNKEHYANDEMIRADLNELTGGKFSFINELNLDLLGTNNYHQNHSPRSSSSNKNKYRKGGRKKSSNKRPRRR